jgi:RecB family exonuclease
MSFGVTIHTTLEKYLAQYQRDMNLKQMGLFDGEQKLLLPPLETLEQLYHEHWVDEWYKDKFDKSKYREKGLEMLRNFYEYSRANAPTPKHIEKKFVLPLGEYEFVGKIDRADTTPEGLAIYDYKTGKKPSSKSGEDVDQLKIYQWAAQDELQEPVASLCYWYLATNEFTPVPLASGEELLALQEKLLATIHEIVDCIRYDKFAELHKAGHMGCRFNRW